MTSIQYINDYYIKVSLKHFDKEEEFVNRCMENVNEASASLNQNQDSALLVIQRGLLLLKVMRSTKGMKNWTLMKMNWKIGLNFIIHFHFRPI